MYIHTHAHTHTHTTSHTHRDTDTDTDTYAYTYIHTYIHITCQGKLLELPAAERDALFRCTSAAVSEQQFS